MLYTYLKRVWVRVSDSSITPLLYPCLQLPIPIPSHRLTTRMSALSPKVACCPVQWSPYQEGHHLLVSSPFHLDCSFAGEQTGPLRRDLACAQQS